MKWRRTVGAIRAPDEKGFGKFSCQAAIPWCSPAGCAKDTLIMYLIAAYFNGGFRHAL